MTTVDTARWCEHGHSAGYKIRIGDLPRNLVTQADLVAFMRSEDGPQALDYNLVIGRGNLGRPYAFITYAKEEECGWSQRYFNYSCAFHEGTKRHNTNAVFVDFQDQDFL